MSYGRLLHRVSELLKVRAIVVAGSFNRAATSLFLSQPALTRRVRELETDLQMELLIRSASGVIPTSAFNEISAHLNQIHDSVMKLGTLLDQIALDHQTRIRCGATSLASSALLPDALDLLGERANLTFEVVDGGFDDLLGRLARREIEVVLGPALSGKIPSDLKGESVCSYEIGLFVRPEDLDGIKSVRLEDLSDNSWLVPPRESKAFLDVVRIFDEANLKLPRKLIYANNIDLIHRVLKNRNVSAFAPVPMFEKEVADGSLVNVEPKGASIQGEVILYTHRSSVENNRLKAFFDAVRRVAMNSPGFVALAKSIPGQATMRRARTSTPISRS
ncbi:LysR family transcriptional regulator [Novosphingobium flavum]|uniref:LysR family transcriptional regulator n=1 Tax=Novosphingobium flavum TaxID=1778672 RepID=A0A7X1FRM0_9SPHN|nr:LysR family transcriptional regulator [Novosphingobium flavum]MBC2665688.1 LysR family transcriptional regulator [Novosphingobium flavum]